MRHLTPADYRQMPWANGRGVTVELLRAEDAAGALLWRLSMARVVEDGPFSVLPGIERNLTVLSGPGFELEGEGLRLLCRPLEPVAFAGDVALRAVGTGRGPSEDFNVMTARSLPRPEVAVLRQGRDLPSGGMLALFALGRAKAAGRVLARHDLVVTRDAMAVEPENPVLAVRLAV